MPRPTLPTSHTTPGTSASPPPCMAVCWGEVGPSTSTQWTSWRTGHPSISRTLSARLAGHSRDPANAAGQRGREEGAVSTCRVSAGLQEGPPCVPADGKGVKVPAHECQLLPVAWGAGRCFLLQIRKLVLA